jgi:hypothetical protein
MALLILVLVAAVVVPVGFGVLAHQRSWSLFGGPTRWGQVAARRYGAVGGALLIVVPGWIIAVLAGLALGELAKHSTKAVDQPVLDWVGHRVNPATIATSGNDFTKLNNKLTLIGNNPTTELVVGISFVILAFAYKRRWYLPLIGLFGAFFAEKAARKIFGKVIDRPRPLATAGTYPSGGVERIVAIYCVVLILVILLMPTLSRAWRAGLWTGLATAGCVEAFTRVYLSKHWMTDAVFALPVGLLLALTHVAAISALAYRRSTDPAAAHPERSRAVEPAA